MSPKRIAILYAELAGYTLACLKTLKQRHHVEIMVFYWPPADNAPFDFQKYEGIDYAYCKKDYTLKSMTDVLNEFDPHIIKISGWMDQDYLKIGRRFKKKNIPVIAGLDAPWRGNLRQQLFRWMAPAYLKRRIDIFWVTGERQAQYAMKFGYTGMNLRYGLYCCDWDRFASSYYFNGEKTGNAFLFVGRYIPIKGIRNLLKAYRNYREEVKDPWKLYCAGSGELCEEVGQVAGVENLGFVQPEDLPRLMQKSTAFVLPSLSEPWGVAIQEATAAGLPVICSDVCGAAAHLVQDAYNGYVFESGNINHLTECLLKMHNLTGEERERMSAAGFELSKQFKPERWADTLMKMLHANELHGISNTVKTV